jgi:hypothetical protein
MDRNLLLTYVNEHNPFPNGKLCCSLLNRKDKPIFSGQYEHPFEFVDVLEENNLLREPKHHVHFSASGELCISAVGEGNKLAFPAPGVVI